MSDVFYNKTITVFNHSASDDVLSEDTWLPTVLTNVRVLETRGRNVSKSGIEAADSVKIHIKTDNLTKPYVEPIAWAGLQDKSSAFTLCQEQDFIVIGDVSNTTITDNFFEVMKEAHDGVYKITNVDKYELIPHLEVGGK